ncbi:hypothetical protein CAL7716_072250 [Calothrix sp. PCC 7716]|nr:hypothetical protein CAL7716_072250 [Calothrix sp. PCC 7716]
MYSSSKINQVTTRSLIAPSISSKVVSGVLTRVIATFTNLPKYINYLTEFQAIFGINAKQSTSNIIIRKADLLINASSNNSAQGLLVCLLVNSIKVNLVNNTKFNSRLWNTSISGGIILNQVIIDLFNPLVTLDGEEYEQVNTVLNLMDY